MIYHTNAHKERICTTLGSKGDTPQTLGGLASYRKGWSPPPAMPLSSVATSTEKKTHQTVRSVLFSGVFGPSVYVKCSQTLSALPPQLQGSKCYYISKAPYHTTCTIYSFAPYMRPRYPTKYASTGVRHTRRRKQ